MFDGMITEDYSKMMNSNVGFQSFDYGDELGNDLGFLMRDQLSGERERGFFRSPSAPPTVEGSLSAAGELFFSPAATAVEGGGHNNRVVSEEELRCDPAYVDYYYSNVNLNPRLPPPLLSKEDWRFTRRVGGDGGGGGLGGIGDRRKLGKSWENGGQSSLVFSDALGFNGGKEGIDAMGQNEWGGDGLIGLPGLGLGSRKKSIAEIIQDDLNNSTSSSRIPSRPASRNAFDETISTPDTQFSLLQHELSSADDPRRGSNVQGLVGNQDTATGVSASLTYASALGTSLSRATTPDPQLVARAPSPRIPPVGEGRVNSIDKRGINGTTSLNGSSNISADLLSAFSGMNLSADNTINEKKQTQPHQNSYLNSYEFGPFQQKSVPHSTKGLYTGKTGGFMLDQNNYYSRTDGPVEFHKTGGPSSPLEYHSVGSPSSAIPDYSLSGHNINPALASMMASQLGNGTLPPLFENAAASAIGVGALDSRASRKNLTPPGKSAIDPFYLQYLGSSEYDPAMDGVNSYMDMLALQKAYLGALPSPQKSECGGPYVGRSGSLNHFYYGNPTFGIGSAYGGSPLVGSGPPVRQNERNMRLGSGIRNLGAGTGTWRSEAGAFMDQSFGSSLLDEFKSNKTRCFELLEISGHVVEFSADQYGSRFIQQKLETASMEEKNMVFHEIMPQVLSLMTDVFGNYVIQKFFEHGTASQIRELADKLTGHVLTLSLQMYGCRVIQKAIEVVELDQQKKMVVELDGHVMRCVRDQNGNHVIQKCIECIPEDAIQFIISTFYDQVVSLSTHPYGCRVIQRVLEHCHDPKTQRIVMDEIMHSVCMLAQDQYGNYVVQHVLEHGKPHERSAIICSLKGKIVKMSQQKFASNVIEKCLTFGDVSERRSMVNEMLGSTDDNEPLQVMMKDQFANYVVQKVLETCDDQQLELILSRIKNHLNALKKYTYGKHIVARVEKLVAAGERRISLQTPYAAQMA